jgi:O-acetyl-ADP-ribose deacetylase (regulator of RNase III)
MKITILKGDITKVKADAIVNAANSQLVAGGGVDGAIHRVAGPELQKECLKIKNERYPKGLPVGEAIITKAYDLPSKFVIHTVGPRFYSQELSLLKNCYINSLKLAEKNNFNSIAFPSISTGAYGVPITKSVEVVNDVLSNYKSNVIKEIILVLFNEEDYKVYFDNIKLVPL